MAETRPKSVSAPQKAATLAKSGASAQAEGTKTSVAKGSVAKGSVAKGSVAKGGAAKGSKAYAAAIREKRIQDRAAKKAVQEGGHMQASSQALGLSAPGLSEKKPAPHAPAGATAQTPAAAPKTSVGAPKTSANMGVTAPPPPPMRKPNLVPQPPPAAPPHATPHAAPHAKSVPLARTAPAETETPIINPMQFDKLTEISSDILAETTRASASVIMGMDTDHASHAPDTSDFTRTLGAVAEYWLKDPARMVAAQSAFSGHLMNVWGNFLRQSNGETITPDPATPARDTRFSDPEWTANPYFNFLRQAYFAGAQWGQKLVDDAELDDRTKLKAAFYMRQLAGALSPSNFVATNPELIRTTLEEQGENIARGMKMLAEDMESGNGELRIRQADGSSFEVGKNIAVSPGKVVFRNELIELIQYAPTTPSVFKTPLLITPPWINKFYILDLNPEKSFIRWAVSVGLTVFVISWVNPDEKLRSYDFEAYMKKGILEAIAQIENATGEREVHTIGYCVGGTLMSVTLAYLAQGERPERIKSTTLFTTQVDFTHAGDLLAFVDEAQIQSIEETMAKTGYLPGTKMANAFNMLRPNDLIWSYMVSNYLKGKNPPAFDLLFWNADSTRMTEANHSYYLRNCYLNNTLSQGKMTVGGRTLDLQRVKTPIYNLAAREDHIAPAKSVFVGSKFFGGPVTYVLAGSGHIAGVVNPVAKPKYQYWTGGPVVGAYEDWVKNTEEHPGSWWPHWLEWVTKGDSQVPARVPGDGKLTPLCDAPGTYVKIKA